MSSWSPVQIDATPQWLDFTVSKFIDTDQTVLGVLRAALRVQPDLGLFGFTVVEGRPLGRVSGAPVTDPTRPISSQDAFLYASVVTGTSEATDEQRAWVNQVMHPYMLARPEIYGAYLVLQNWQNVGVSS